MEVESTRPPAGSFPHILFMDSAKTWTFSVPAAQREKGVVLVGPFQHEGNQVSPGAINPFCPITCMKIQRGPSYRHKHSLHCNCWGVLSI